MNTLVGKPIKVAMSAALLAAVFFALPVKMDAQHPLGFSAALAGSRHDSASPFNNNTDNVNPEQNAYVQRNDGSPQAQYAQHIDSNAQQGQTAQSNGN
jgi:hypothetical protein